VLVGGAQKNSSLSLGDELRQQSASLNVYIFSSPFHFTLVSNFNFTAPYIHLYILPHSRVSSPARQGSISRNESVEKVVICDGKQLDRQLPGWGFDLQAEMVDVGDWRYFRENMVLSSRPELYRSIQLEK